MAHKRCNEQRQHNRFFVCFDSFSLLVSLGVGWGYRSPDRRAFAPSQNLLYPAETSIVIGVGDEH